MSIEKNIENKQDAINAERAASATGNSDIANSLQVKATAAVYGGTTEWKNYMQEFAITPEEMGRLQPGAGDLPNSERNLARAYLLGNGICGPASTGGVQLSFTVGNKLDF